jgi:hypothetical protein
MTGVETVPGEIVDPEIQLAMMEIVGTSTTTPTSKVRVKVTDLGALSVGIVSGGGIASYSDSGGTDKKGLVDTDRHVQVDVLSAPAIPHWQSCATCKLVMMCRQR